MIERECVFETFVGLAPFPEVTTGIVHQNIDPRLTLQQPNAQGADLADQGQIRHFEADFIVAGDILNGRNGMGAFLFVAAH